MEDKALPTTTPKHKRLHRFSRFPKISGKNTFAPPPENSCYLGKKICPLVSFSNVGTRDSKEGTQIQDSPTWLMNKGDKMEDSSELP
jgi:hypothetical protein